MSHVIRFLLAFPASLWAGYVVSILWGWYLEPIGAPHLSVMRAVGLSVILAAMRSPKIPMHKDKREEYGGGELLIMSVFLWGLAPGIALLLGWFWRHWL